VGGSAADAGISPRAVKGLTRRYILCVYVYLKRGGGGGGGG